MKNQTKKICPFKKQIERKIKRGKHGEPDVIMTERFDCCAGDRCMAYRGGKCARIAEKGTAEKPWTSGK